MYATSPDVIESTPALAMQIMPQKTSRAVVGGSVSVSMGTRAGR